MSELSEFIKTFSETLLSRRRSLGSSGYEPVYYLVYSPERTVEMQNIKESLTSRLVQEGVTVHVFDVFQAVWRIWEEDPNWREILEWNRENPEGGKDLQETLSSVLDDSGAIVTRLREAIQSAAQKERAVLFVTGLEALHSYLRPGSLENRLNGEFSVPTVFFYPGRMEGKNGLRFLNFYSLDVNYRSGHFAVPASN